MYSEFVARTKKTVSLEEYHYIEASYYDFDGNKDEFCKAWLKDLKNGKWSLELRLRKALDEQKAELEEKLQYKQDYIDFLEPYFDRARNAETRAKEAEAKLQRIADRMTKWGEAISEDLKR